MVPSKHLRWSEKGKFFPANKYGFNEHLTHVGCFVTTFPMSNADGKRFRDAAYEWAWHKKWGVKCSSNRKGNGLSEYTCQLVAKHLVREFT